VWVEDYGIASPSLDLIAQYYGPQRVCTGVLVFYTYTMTVMFGHVNPVTAPNITIEPWIPPSRDNSKRHCFFGCGRSPVHIYKCFKYDSPLVTLSPLPVCSSIAHDAEFAYRFFIFLPVLDIIAENPRNVTIWHLWCSGSNAIFDVPPSITADKATNSSYASWIPWYAAEAVHVKAAATLLAI
jgi:hypothetical protein